MKKALAILLAALTASSLLMTGCGEKDEGNKDGEKKCRVVMICSALGDKSYYDIAYEGLKKAETDLGVEIKVAEIGTDKAKMEPAIQDVADAGYDIIFFGSTEYIPIIEKHQDEYKESKFVGFDIEPSTEIKMSNMFCITYMQNQVDFLAGALAQKMSKSGTIGFLGGTEGTIINDFLIGFIEGSLLANPKGKVASSYIGSWTDAAKGKEMALVQIKQLGADLLHPCAMGAGLGVIEACRDNGLWAIGVDADQREFFIDSKKDIADAILTSAMKRGDMVVYKVIKDELAGTQTYGSLEKWGLKEEAVGLAKNDYYKEHTPQEVQTYIDGLEKKLVSGEQKVSTMYGMSQDEFVKIRESVKP